MSTVPVRLSQGSGVPFFRQIVTQLSVAIRSGELEAGTLLPSVRALSTQLLVSAITVRRAYLELSALGLIEQRRGSGTYVADVPVSADPGHLGEARDALTQTIQRLRSLGLADEDIRDAFEASLTPEGEDP